MDKVHALADQRGRVQILSLSCSFWQKKSQNNPNLGVGALPQENPGSSTAKSTVKLVNTDVRTCELKNMIDMI